jgi:hypothetical protein
VAGVVVALGVAAARADEPRRLIDMSRVFDAGAAPPDPALSPIPPDPAPLAAKTQWVFDLRWDRGDPWLLGVRKVELDAPRATPRAMGRFALELFEGPTLIERVRFDFPLLGVPETTDAGAGAVGSAAAAPSLTQKLRTRVGVFFPATARGTRLELWDRATGRRWSLPWPEPTAAPAASTPTGANAPDLVP